jgi:hypothetical protein
MTFAHMTGVILILSGFAAHVFILCVLPCVTAIPSVRTGTPFGDYYEARVNQMTRWRMFLPVIGILLFVASMCAAVIILTDPVNGHGIFTKDRRWMAWILAMCDAMLVMGVVSYRFWLHDLIQSLANMEKEPVKTAAQQAPAAQDRPMGKLLNFTPRDDGSSSRFGPN